MNAADLVREARRRAGLTQAQLAERLATTQSTIARLEAGGRDPSFGTLENVIRACGLDMSIRLGPHDDHDLTLARLTDDLTPGERIEHMLDRGRKIEDLLASMERR